MAGELASPGGALGDVGRLQEMTGVLFGRRVTWLAARRG